MRNRICALMVSAALLGTLSACKTAGDAKLASDTTPTRANSSWCQGDSLIQYAPADRAGQDDPGNRLDSDETVTAVQEHNARLRAACPEGEARANLGSQ